MSKRTDGGAERGAGCCELVKGAGATFRATLVCILSGVLLSDAAIPLEITDWEGLSSWLKAE